MPISKEPARAISNDTHAKVEDLLNKAVHELVFASHHSEQDEAEDALTCLVQAQMNIEAVSDMLLDHKN